MPFNVSGVFQRLYSWATDRDNAVKISASRMDGEFNGMADALTAVVQQAQPFKGAIKSTSGTAALPGYTFDGDLNTGIYQPGADQVAVSTNGVQRLLMTTAMNTWAQPHRLPDGSSGTPALAFSGAPTTGIYRIAGSGDMVFRVGGAGGFSATAQGLMIEPGADLLLGGRIEIVGGGNLVPLVVATGTANALAVTVPMLAPQMFWMFAPAANTGSTTLSINGGAAVTLRTPNGANLPAGYTRFAALASQPILIFNSSSEWVAVRGTESGGGLDGSWTKYPDGRLECDVSIATLSGSAATWTFPQAFTATPRVVVTPSNTVGSGTHEGVSATSVGVNVLNFSGSRVAGFAHAIAVGRWF